MSSFFTLSASEKKRKRVAETTLRATKRRITGTSEGAQRSKKLHRDESISGSESDHIGTVDGARGIESDRGSTSSDLEGETGPERRLRLAERYLDNVREEVDAVGFDAADVDRDLIAERLREGVAETKGQLYRRIASKLRIDKATSTRFRADTLTTTSVATCFPHAYTVSKDLTLIKWEIQALQSSQSSQAPDDGQNPPRKHRLVRRRPVQLIFTKGNKNRDMDNTYQHHTAAILTVAASSDGRFVATGGADKRLIVWSALDLKPLKVFTQHRDAVTGLVFRRGTNQLFSSSKDRTIKIWSLNELAYLDTLHGHQEGVVSISSLALERCLSAGARDRTARLWKVVEETQLVFRGGGGGGDKKSTKQAISGDHTDKQDLVFNEGSIDCIAHINEETFITGSDNGSLSLWTLHKKKPVFSMPLAHGLDPSLKPEEAFADKLPNRIVPSPPQPRWITALATVPYSDLILSGSWDGWIRIWRVSEDKRRIERVGAIELARNCKPIARQDAAHSNISDEGQTDGMNSQFKSIESIVGVINDICICERGRSGEDGICIIAAVGKEHRLGRWKKPVGKNGTIVLEVPFRHSAEE